MKTPFTVLLKMVLLLWSGAVSQAQNKAIDSLFREGILAIYEHPDKTIEIGERILVLRKDNIRATIKVLVMISDAYSSKRDYRKSVQYLIKAQNLSEPLKDDLVKIHILTKTAVQYQQLRIYDDAIRYLDEARTLIMAYPAKDSVQSVLGSNYTIRGFIYKEQLDCNIAIDYFDKGIAEYKKIKGRFKNGNLSIVSYNKGNCYILLSDYTLARKSFNEAIAFAKNIEAKSLQAFAQKGLAEVFTLEGHYENAISGLIQAEKLSANVGDLVLNQGIYRGLAENYLATSDWENYLKFQNLYNTTQKKIVESERKSIGLALNEQQKILDGSAQKSTRNYLLMIVALLGVFMAAIFLIFRKHRTARKTIEDLKTAIQNYK